ncbi:protein-L-isoaspartate O-methyltransferase [Candidatus Bathyarchaeota archaeon]|nr:protein-L-isoaspartate O-methyltransferase [Candidatus Bathyarchaeota archaeon]
MAKDFKEQRDRVIDALIAQGILCSPSVISAMRAVPREEFIPKNLRDYAYVDTPLPIGYGQTISAIHMVAMMCEALDLKPGHKVLEVGAGSGYHAAVVAEIVAPKGASELGHVYTIEVVPKLVEFARSNLERAGYGSRVTVCYGDGSKGHPSAAPYDRVFVTAAAPSIPNPLIEQLKPGGLLVIPVGGLHLFQSLLLVEKGLNGKTSVKNLGGVAFVPLVGEYGWKP